MQILISIHDLYKGIQFTISMSSPDSDNDNDNDDFSSLSFEQKSELLRSAIANPFTTTKSDFIEQIFTEHGGQYTRSQLTEFFESIVDFGALEEFKAITELDDSSSKNSNENISNSVSVSVSLNITNKRIKTEFDNVLPHSAEEANLESEGAENRIEPTIESRSLNESVNQFETTTTEVSIINLNEFVPESHTKSIDFNHEHVTNQIVPLPSSSPTPSNSSSNSNSQLPVLIPARTPSGRTLRSNLTVNTNGPRRLRSNK